MKKLIITLTILSFLNLIGCYYQEKMNPDDYQFSEELTMEVTTKDTLFKFKGNDYYLKTDTLFGKISIPINKRTGMLNVKIPVNHIEKVEVDRIDGLKTTLSIVGVLGVILVIGALTYKGPEIKMF